MRKRKNANTIVLAYRYWAQPIADVPDYLWVLARGMQTTWNRMVQLHQAALFSAQTLPADSKAVWSAFEAALSDLAQKAREQYNWEIGNDLYDRFRASLRRLKTTGRGPARAHDDDLYVAIPHQFSGGGIHPDVLSSERGWRLKLEDGKWTDRTRVCHFGLNKAHSVRLLVRWHRPFPPGAIIKMARLCARKEPYQGWQWWLVFSLELPAPQPHPSCGTARVSISPEPRPGVIHLGAAIGDDGGAIDLTLPLLASTTHTRRHKLPETAAAVEAMRELADRIEREEPERAQRLRSIAQHQSNRIIGRRRWLYRNWAAALARRYGVIEITEHKCDDRGVNRVAAPRELIDYIRQAAVKAGGVAREISQTPEPLEQKEDLRKKRGRGQRKATEPTGFPSAVTQHVQPG